jgi:hypothetical protein
VVSLLMMCACSCLMMCACSCLIEALNAPVVLACACECGKYMHIWQFARCARLFGWWACLFCLCTCLLVRVSVQSEYLCA